MLTSTRCYTSKNNQKHKLKMRDKGWMTPSRRKIQMWFIPAKEVSVILGCINRSIRSKTWQVMVPLYSVLVKPYLEYCVYTVLTGPFIFKRTWRCCKV